MKMQANENESMRKRIHLASLLVLTVLCVVLAAVSASPQSQTPVPTTAREAAASPEFANRLTPRPMAKAVSRFVPSEGGDPCHPNAGTTTFYKDGPTDGNDNAFFISGPNLPNPAGSFQDISNGFVSAASGTPNQLEFGEWVFSGSTPTSIGYEIGTTAFGTDLGSGSVAQTTCPGAGCNSTFLFTNSFGYDIYDVTIPLTSAAMTAGNTYWVSLSNATNTGSSQTGAWDEAGPSGGPATCNFRQSGTNYGSCGTGGESFTITGGPQPPQCTNPTLTITQSKPLCYEGVGDVLTSRTDMAGTFTDKQGLCSYRQSVKGRFWQLVTDPVNGVTLQNSEHPLTGKEVYLREDVFNEDGNVELGRQYGHRKAEGLWWDQYTDPSQDKGDKYTGADGPSTEFKGSKGMDLYFEGCIIDTDSGNVVGPVQEWDVMCSTWNVQAPMPEGRTQDKLLGSGPQVCEPLKEAAVATSLSDGTPVLVELHVCSQTPKELLVTLVVAETPINSSEVTFHVISPLDLPLLQGPTGPFSELGNAGGSQAVGVYWFDFSHPFDNLFVQLSVRGGSVLFPVTLQPPPSGPLAQPSVH